MSSSRRTRSVRRQSIVDRYSVAYADGASIYKEGWLLKRGEYIKTWRKRYCQLMTDGMFYGFKTRPRDDDVAPENCFLCNQGVGIEKEDKARDGAFSVRVETLDFNPVKRMFCAESAEDRDSWMDAINNVAAEDKDELAVLRRDERISEASLEKGKSEGLALEDFVLLKTLGKGGYGKVVLSRFIRTDEIVALKIIKKELIVKNNLEHHLWSEKNVLQRTDHPFLASLICSFQTPERLVFVLEYIQGGELFFHLCRERRFPTEWIRIYGAEILDAIDYLHQCGIIYRDLKLENILLAYDGHIKITDFGLCKEGIWDCDDNTMTICGTPEYLAPEALEDGEYTRSVDWYALGIALFEMAAGYLPFRDDCQDVLFAKILHDTIKFPVDMCVQLQSLIANLVDKDPTYRLGHGPDDAQEIKAHPFFKGMDFEKLRRKEIPPPFIPSGDEDTATPSNFDDMFTMIPARLTYDGISRMEDMVRFSNFSFTAEETNLAT